LVLRTEEPCCRSERVLRGRAGASRNMRQFHRYMLRPEGVSKASVNSNRYVAFSEEYLDPRGGGGLSKAQMILDYLVEHGDEAFFSADLVEALGDRGVKGSDIMSNVRRYEAKGLIYVRGYKSEKRETPFKEGFLMSYIDQESPPGRCSEGGHRPDRCGPSGQGFEQPDDEEDPQDTEYRAGALSPEEDRLQGLHRAEAEERGL
jgi:hypothetical protein